jgi:hypothetical protein
MARGALERAGHNEVKLGGQGNAAAMETARVATLDSKRWRKQVKKVLEGEAKLGA